MHRGKPHGTPHRARVLVTTEALYRRRVPPLREHLPELVHVVLVGEGGELMRAFRDLQAGLRATVLGVLGEVAPEADLGSLRSDLPLREQPDLDSMDMLNVVVGLHAALGVEVPEVDDPKLATLDGCVESLASRTRV
jgi:acyl carrier protein